MEPLNFWQTSHPAPWSVLSLVCLGQKATEVQPGCGDTEKERRHSTPGPPLTPPPGGPSGRCNPGPRHLGARLEPQPEGSGASKLESSGGLHQAGLTVGTRKGKAPG